jgi:hypothetical protein
VNRQIRILLAAAALALLAGWLGLRTGNASLEDRIERGAVSRP